MSEAARDWGASNEPARPMRIEFATSELEGGPCRAWADPSFVLGAVAVSDPSDGFTKFVQPRLEELDAFGEATGGDLPPIVTQLIDHLQKIHARLVRERGADKPATIALTCAAVEEDRVFFVKTCPAWIGLVRGTRAHAVERPSEEDFSHPVGLGASEKLSLEVTSLPVQPGDIVLLLCSDMHATPDLRAVANVFNQTNDLRRACDGLVNLLGLQSEGAGAIAFRFVPVGASGQPEADPIVPLAEVPRPAASKIEDPFAAMKTAMPASSGRARVHSEAESFLDSLGDGTTGPIRSGEMTGEYPDSRSASIDSRSVRTACSGEEAYGSGAALPQPVDPYSAGGAALRQPSDPYSAPGVAQHAHPQMQRNQGTPFSGGDAPAYPASSRPPMSQQAPAPHPAMPASPLPASPLHAQPMSGAPESAHPHAAGGPASGMAAGGAASNIASADPALAGSHPAQEAASAMSSRGATGLFHAGQIDSRPRRSRRNLWISIAIVIVIAGLLAIMAIPSGPDLPGSSTIRNLFGSAAPETGELQIAPEPPARAVLLDGVAVAGGTPTVLPAVEVGPHRIGLDLGLLGLWETELDIAPGTNSLSPRLTGSVKVAAADPSVPGHVWVDGGSKSPVPATLTDLPVGWVRIYYEDENLPIWERQVLVRADRTSPLVVPNDVADGEGRIEVEALHFGENRGLEPSSGDSIWIDDQPAGVTPLEASVEPGFHSVRVRSRDGESFTDILNVHPGSGRHVLAQFGVSTRPALHHTAPGRVAVSGKLVLSVEVVGELDPHAARPALHFPDLDASLREVPLTPVDEGENVFVAVVDAERMPRNSQVPYYFSILGPDGRPVYSDLYRVVLRDPSASSVLSAPRRKDMAARAAPPSEQTADRSLPLDLDMDPAEISAIDQMEPEQTAR